MALYTQLYDLQNDSVLMNRTCIAVADIAMDIYAEVNTTPNHANRLLWAKDALDSPISKAPGMLRVALVKNKALTTAQIQGADDPTLKAALAGVVDLFATGA